MLILSIKACSTPAFPRKRRRKEIGAVLCLGFTPMAMVWRMLLLFLAVLPAQATSGAHGDGNLTVLCHSDEAATLLQLKKSFLFSKATTSLPSWQDGSNCCRWEGVGCGGSIGHVTTLNLNGRGLISRGLDPVIFNLTSLRFLDLSMNDFGGMSIKSGFSGYSMPAVGLEKLTFLAHLNLSKSGFVGKIPIGIGKLENLISLDLSCNRLSGDVPNSVWRRRSNSLVYLNLSHNMFTGKIPTSLCGLPMLEVFALAYNNFSGPITTCLLEIARLRVLNLRENNFEGTLPSNVASECTLQKIDLHGNNIEGLLPRALSNCNKLEILDMGNNLMVDTFPFWLGELSNLYVLILRFNQFYGSIDDVGNNKSREYFSSLQIIDLASNKFSGNLSSEWFWQLKSMMSKLNSRGHIVAQSTLPTSEGFYQNSIQTTFKGFPVTFYVTFERTLDTFTCMDFSNNRLEGAIPESVGELVSLVVLNMSRNAFTGKIPAQLGGLANLESLDLSCNQLSGEIPQELTDLTYLTRLNLSDNQLVGKIPQSGQFLTFDYSSFKGNLGLWRPPLSNPYDASPAPPSEDYLEKSSDDDSVIIVFVGLGFVVGFGAAILQLF